ncbi:MAG: type I DNA topoisomerase [Patescibacteria group bacterium]|jgi:DNA topoisomerase-1|nr:type I DNA topoisomerase [Patescibacteria group bacterium]
MQLIIVESPTKAKTISKFLGSDFKVESSFGHVNDLPKSKMGIDIENNFEPQYIIPTKAKKIVTNLKKIVKDSDQVILASDEDREGEAIAWHLANTLKLKDENIKRIVFHEITKEAILESLKHPRGINQDMVDAQQARRVLDRLVGYELSPFLWKKVAKGLSAGRVQSVATKMIVEKEKEIKAFVSEDYASINALFEEDKKEFSAILNKINNKSFDKLELKKDKAEKINKEIEKQKYLIKKIDKKTVSKNSPSPFTTSSLQQTANRYLGFSAKQTMSVAQKLYEFGYITYMRTDSLNLSPKFIKESREWIETDLGKDYLPEKPKVFKTKSKGAQEAHEAVRPTEVANLPDSLQAKLEPTQLRLYRLIWQRAVSSQINSAKINTTSLDIETKTDDNIYNFRANGQNINFLGYLKVWPEKTKEQVFPNLKEGDYINLKNTEVEEHSTTPPARYSDATLVKEMEKHGIGRPSTYAPTINTIITRNYVERDENKRLKPTDIAFVVSDLLSKHFKNIVSYDFTANLENDLDKIANGEKKWQPVIKTFYEDFHQNLEEKYKEINKQDIMPEEKSEEKCDKCGAAMIIKTGRFGKFLACSAYPDCKNIKGLKKDKPQSKEQEEKVKKLQEKHKDVKCDKCGSDMVIKVGKYGPFLACSSYPKCKNIKNIDDDEIKVKCPICEKGNIVKKISKRGVFYACNEYPKCKNAYWGKPTGDKCPDCESLIIEDLKTSEKRCSNKDCGYKK